jgi:hypothetical protein
MRAAFHLTTEPALLDLGRTGGAELRASVPFYLGTSLHAANHNHYVRDKRRGFAVVRAREGFSSGVIQVIPSA